MSWKEEFRGLSQTESLVLTTIASYPGIDATEIEAQTDLDQPQASRTLKKLKERGLIRAITSQNRKPRRCYYLEPKQGSKRLWKWVDSFITEILFGSPNVVTRILAALEEIPDETFEKVEKCLEETRSVRNQRRKADHGGVSYSLARRNRRDHRYRRLFEG